MFGWARPHIRNGPRDESESRHVHAQGHGRRITIIGANESSFIRDVITVGESGSSRIKRLQV